MNATRRTLLMGSLAPLLLLLVGVALSSLAAYYSDQAIKRAAREDFEQMSSRAETEIEHRLERVVYALRGAGGLYATRSKVSLTEFQRYVFARDLDKEFPGVRGFGFIQWVERSALAQFEEEVRGDAAPDFSVRAFESKPLPDLFVVRFIEPAASNQGALGLDVGSEKQRRAGIQQAITTGAPTITGSIALVQDDKKMPGVLLFNPVYRQGASLDTPQQRRAALLGVLYAPIVMSEILHNIPDVQSGRLDLEIVDAPINADRGTVMFDADLHTTGVADPSGGGRGRNFSLKKPLQLPGRSVTIRTNSTHVFEAAIDRSPVWVLLVAGILVSTLLSFVLHLQASGRRRAEKLARNMTFDLDRLAQVVRHTSNAVSIADREGRIHWINEAFTRLTGWSATQAAGKSSAELFRFQDERSSAAVAQAQTAAAKDGVPCRMELACTDASGAVYWIELEIEPQFDAQGIRIGALSIASDITQRRQAVDALQAALRDNEALLSTLNMHAIVSITDRDGRITEVNDAFCQISGYSREELIGQSHQIVNSDVQGSEFWNRMWAEISSAKPWRGEVCHTAKDGSHYWVDTFVAPFIGNDGRIDKYISIRTDITANKQAEAALQWSQSLLEKMSDSSPLGFLVVDNRTDDILYFNQRFCSIWGIEALADRMRNKQIKNRDLDPHCRNLLVDADAYEASCLPLQSVENRITMEDEIALQEFRTIRRFTTQIRDAADKYYGRFYIFEDITGRKNAELILTRAIEEANEASRSKGQFLANMSHEIRTPMNAILGLLKLLQDTELTTRQRDYASKTEGAAKSLLGLLNDILDFSKVEAGKMTLESEPFSIDRLLRNLSVVLSANVGSKDVEVLFDVDPALPAMLRGDSMRLQQVLINLGGNAVKFTSSGHVVIALRVIGVADGEAHIEFSVRDTGIGIAPEHQAHIFSGFSQAEGSTTRRFGGTGLGLAISKRLVQLMGGDIQVSSALGAGSTFSFSIRLPVDPSGAASEVSRKLPQAHRVLVIDDNPVAGGLLLRMVRSLGYAADWADSGARALEMIGTATESAAREFAYPLIYVDWQMPQMDGWETTRRIKAFAAARQLPSPHVVMMTAQGRESLSSRSEDEHALISALLIKPLTTSMLVDACNDIETGASNVRQFAKGRSSQRQLRGMRILVVEDNLINQQVAEELLGAEGALVSLAANGQIGVDAVAAAAPQFDAILMDIQMPVLDGYGATRAIREDLGLRQLPIIAMTANAMASDRDACLAAGMTEHIGKPFDMARLVSLLIRVTNFSAIADEVESGGNSQQEQPALPTFAGLELDAAIARMSGMRQLYVRTAVEFVKMLGTVKMETSQCLESGNARKLHMLLHTLKGNAATLGLGQLARLAAQMEADSKSAQSL